MKILNVGLCYNLIQDYPRKSNDAEDADAEWTDEKDVETIVAGLTEAGFNVVKVGEPANLLKPEIREQIDIVFSIAEMTGYRYRESIAPVICELFNMPYTFSTPDVMVIGLDKNLCNLLVRQIGIPVPEWVVIKDVSALPALNITDFPYILKPIAEGSSIGISSQSIVYTKEQAISRVKQILELYNQPVLLQKFIQGREITIGVVERSGEATPLAPIEVMTAARGETDVNDAWSKKLAEDGKMDPIKDPKMVLQIKDYARKIFREFSCRDTARIDFRVDRHGVIYFMEINPLTDYTPRKDFCKSAFAAGYDYPTILKTIISNAWENGRSR